MLLDRFKGALHLCDVLAQAGARDDAQTILGETIDLLVVHDAAGMLPPLVAAKARAYVGRWVKALDDELWIERLRALERAEGGAR